MLLEIAAVGLGIGATALSIATILLAVRFYKLQTKQGERIAVSVISTTDQIYRRLRARVGEGAEDEDDEDYVSEDIVESSVSGRFILHDRQVEIRLSGYLSASVMGRLKARCTVEEPSGRRAEVLRDVVLSDGFFGSFDVDVIFPRDFANASTSEPGRYHVSWRLRDEWVLEQEGKQEQGSQGVGIREDAFAVMPW